MQRGISTTRKMANLNLTRPWISQNGNILPSSLSKTYNVYFLFSVVFWSILVHRAHPVPRMKVGPVPGHLYLQSPINDNKVEVCVSDITFQNRNTIRK